MNEHEAAIHLLLRQSDRTPWAWRPQWHWHGWQTLLPLMLGHDEYARRTLVIGWTITGRLIIPIGDCGDPECHRDAINAIRDAH